MELPANGSKALSEVEESPYFQQTSTAASVRRRRAHRFATGKILAFASASTYAFKGKLLPLDSRKRKLLPLESRKWLEHARTSRDTKLTTSVSKLNVLASRSAERPSQQ